MKPIADVVMVDKQAEATLRKLFEDLYNRVIPSDTLNKALREGKLDRPHIDSTSTGIELPYAYIYAHCYPIQGASIYVWALRRQGTYNWTGYFSTDNEIKILHLYFATTYEIRVLAIGPLLIKSPWSAYIPILTPSAPKPSKVTGITVTNHSLYVDPTTGVTLASVKVSWDNNADSELVDSYEIIWYE